MANLLQTPTLFKDGANASPPSEWNGTAYVGTVPDTLTFTGTAVAGDTLACTITGATPDQGHLIAVKVNGTDVIAWDTSYQSYPPSIAITLAAGDAVVIQLQTDGCGYPPEITLTPPTIPVPPAKCTELGRTSACRVSGYNRARVHQTRLMAGEKRCLVADFNGALPVGRTIASVRWRMDLGCVVAMASARIPVGLRSTEIDITAVWIGSTMIQCEATLDNGDNYTQMFVIDVSGNPFFLPASTTSGPLELTA